MKVLGIEAATPLAGAAVVEVPEAADGASGVRDARVLAETVLDVHRAPAERLLSQVEAVLRDSGVGLAGIDLVGVSAGPGSFTGIRVGLACAQGLAQGAGRPLVAVPTLAVLAGPFLAAGLPVLAVLDARRGEVYYAFFAGGGLPEMEPTSGPGAVRPEALAGRIAEALPPAGRIPVIGSGAALCRAPLEAARPGRFVHPGGAADAPRPAWAALLAAERHRAGGGPPAPVYVRRSDAEEARHGRDRR